MPSKNYESFASSPGVRARMQAQPSWDTKPELALRRRLHARGLRYRVHRRPLAGLRRQADVIFPRERVAVFVDSCFWHRCPEHYHAPKANAAWWEAKTRRTSERDRETDALLREAGWLPLRVWEHEDLDEAVVRVADAVLSRRNGRPRSQAATEVQGNLH
jgi:DNA mismatch endonuclease (patch repair protein)